MKLIVRLSIFLVLTAMFTLRCANQGSPTGGPRDSLAPVVVRTTPTLYATNFTGKKILIEFDEYVQLKEAQKLFFVSPPGKQKPKLTIKGKGIEVLFEDGLDSATTYRLDFGSSIVDNNEANPLHGYSFVFSTGPVIDSLVMAGQTIGAYQRDSLVNNYIFFFDSKADSLQVDSTMFNGKVEALFRTDSSGYFVADILKDKKYRVYALDDKNGNQKYDPGTDRIGFTDRTFNPAEMGGFTMTYDSTKKYMVIDSLQVVFELFKEIPVRRQLITKQERPHRQKMLMTFNSANPVFDSLTLEGVNPDWLIRENGITGDSVTLWVAPPSRELLEKLTDTIRGFISLQMEDSIWQPYFSHEKLTFVHKLYKKETKREAKPAPTKVSTKKGKKGKDIPLDQTPVDTISNTLALVDSTAIAGAESDTQQTKEPEKSRGPDAKNPFAFKVSADNPLNPERHIVFDFDYPLRVIDSSRIELYNIQQIEQKGRDAKAEVREVKVPFTLHQSPTNIKRWEVRAKWKKDEEYRLMIPSKTFEDITFESNDTLQSKFKVANPDKYGQLIFKMPADTTDHNVYILELVQGSGDKMTITDRRQGVAPGNKVTFSYLKPGTYALRIIQDTNANGTWDTGSLTLRREPEKVRMVVNEYNQRKLFIAKENWSVEEVINQKKLFEQ